jgi:hypothetical protein
MILAQTFGSLSAEDADAMEKAVEEGCEQIDEPGWRVSWWTPAS